MKIGAIDQMPSLREFIKKCNFDKKKSLKLKCAYFISIYLNIYILVTFNSISSYIV